MITNGRMRGAAVIGLSLATLSGCVVGAGSEPPGSIVSIPATVPTDLGVTDTCRAIYQALLDANATAGEIGTDSGRALGMFLRLSADLRAAATSGRATADEGHAAQQLAQAYDDLAAGFAKGDADTSILGPAMDAVAAACGGG